MASPPTKMSDIKNLRPSDYPYPQLSNHMETSTHTAPPVTLARLVLLLNEAYVFLGMPHKALHPWRIALDEWQAKVEQETGWNHFAEVKKFEQNAKCDSR